MQDLPAQRLDPRSPAAPFDGNAARFRGPGRPHVESWFAKLVEPQGGRALWLKCTVLARAGGAAVAEAWAVAFERGTEPVGVKETVPAAAAQLGRAGLDLRVARLEMREGRLSGRVASGGRSIELDLAFTPGPAPLELIPWRALYDDRLPTTKLLSPHPDSLFRGSYAVDGRRVEVEGWRGMQGHNWGRRHTPRYAWAHVNQWDDGEELLFEGFTGHVGAGLPPITLLCVASRGVRYRFDAPLALLGARGTLGARSWRFRARSAQARVEGELSAETSELAGLLYENPSGPPLTCLNSKLASGQLRFEVRGRPPIEARTRAAALELGTMETDHGVRMLV